MKKFDQIAEFGQKLMTLKNMDHALELISDEAKKLVNADRCSIFIVDKEDKMLWTKLSDGIPNPIWLPHAVEPLAYPKKSYINKYDVCFVGNIGGWERVDFLDRMFKEFPNFFKGKKSI